MTEDGDDPATATAIASVVVAAGSLATTGVALAKGGPNLPDVPPPAPPPKPPPPPAPVKPPTDMGDETAGERRKRATRFGVADTLLVSPLGGSDTSRTTAKSLLGG